MANQEHHNILKQGVAVWNQWREEHPDILPDLSSANLEETTFRRSNLWGVILEHTNLIHADLSYANLKGANLKEADLSEAFLVHANFSETNLINANLSGAFLDHADFSKANLCEALFRETHLSNADFSEATIGWTTFGDVDLRLVKGLDTVTHQAPSYISTSTLSRSQGNFSDAFLQGAGLSDSFIHYTHALINNPIEYYTCFISYSNKDHDFVERLHADLQRKGVRCWFAPKDMRIGDKIRVSIEEAIRLYDKLLIVLSENSVESDWVEKEVETAFEKERQQKRPVLFPIKLDRSVMDTLEAWAADIRRTRHIGDFSNWKNPDDYQRAIIRLLRDLEAENK